MPNSFNLPFTVRCIHMVTQFRVMQLVPSWRGSLLAAELLVNLIFKQNSVCALHYKYLNTQPPNSVHVGVFLHCALLIKLQQRYAETRLSPSCLE
jgi:hypothetical protein